MAILGKNAFERDIFDCLKVKLREYIGGDVYLSECRPQDSGKEDAVIVVSTATAGQIQEGRAKVNIYVADINVGGKKVPNVKRLRELEAIDCELIDLLNLGLADYDFWFSSMTNTLEESATKEHFININLGYKHKTF